MAAEHETRRQRNLLNSDRRSADIWFMDSPQPVLVVAADLGPAIALALRVDYAGLPFRVAGVAISVDDAVDWIRDEPPGAVIAATDVAADPRLLAAAGTAGVVVHDLDGVARSVRSSEPVLATAC
jgi:hypothetical protein